MEIKEHNLGSTRGDPRVGHTDMKAEQRSRHHGGAKLSTAGTLPSFPSVSPPEDSRSNAPMRDQGIEYPQNHLGILLQICDYQIPILWGHTINPFFVNDGHIDREEPLWAFVTAVVLFMEKPTPACET